MLDWFTLIALSLCFIGAALSPCRKAAFAVFITFVIFEIIYFYKLHVDSSYFLWAIIIDTILILICAENKASKSVIVFISCAIACYGVSFIFRELSAKSLYVWEIYMNFIYIYYESVMKAIIIMIAFSIFKDGCLNGYFERIHKPDNRGDSDIDSFHACWVGANKGVYL